MARAITIGLRVPERYLIGEVIERPRDRVGGVDIGGQLDNVLWSDGRLETGVEDGDFDLIRNNLPKIAIRRL